MRGDPEGLEPQSLAFLVVYLALRSWMLCHVTLRPVRALQEHGRVQQQQQQREQ